MTYPGPIDTRNLLTPWKLNPDDFAQISILADLDNHIAGTSAVIAFLPMGHDTQFSWDAWASATGAEILNSDQGLSSAGMPLPDGRSLLEVSAITEEFRTLRSPSDHQAVVVRLTEGIVLHISGLNNADVESILSLPAGTINKLCPSPNREYRIAFQ